MATAGMAMAAGAAIILYLMINRRSEAANAEEEGGDRSTELKSSRSLRRKVSRRPAQAPATWFETMTTLSETLRFTYSETLGKWPIGDLAFGINYLLRRQGDLQVASVYAGSACVQLKGPEIVAELKYYLRLLTFCILFSKKPFPVFLESAGYSEADVLLKQPKAGIVGHSLGGGTAALLTYILREQKELSTSTCVTFAPAACMTWELAESGKHFITTIINGSDLVPTFSTASIDELRSEVTASSWLNDLRDQVERTRVLNVLYRSASAIGSRLPSIATSARARVAGAGALLRPVSSGTQVVMKGAQNVAQAVVRRRPTLSSWSCMGARRRTNIPLTINPEDDMSETSLITTTTTSETLETETSTTTTTKMNSDDYNSSSGEDLGNNINDSEEEEEQLLSADKDITSSTMEAVSEGELWYQLEKELQKQKKSILRFKPK